MYEKFDANGTKVENHIQDRNVSINKMIKDRGNIRNSNEKWHATKPITKQARKIATGRRGNIGKTWHPQLSDKGSLIRNHAYWAMDNCHTDAAELRRKLDICLTHFHNRHDHCVPTSVCRAKGFVPSYSIVTDPAALEILTTFLHSMIVYKNAEDYVLACNTYYVESFNNTCLIYQDKRIHYGNVMYKMRIELAILDWNEHVDRPYTSVHKSMRPNHPRKHLGKKAYKKKSYKFVKNIWELLVAVLKTDDALDNDTQNEAQAEDLEYDVSDVDIDDEDAYTTYVDSMGDEYTSYLDSVGDEYTPYIDSVGDENTPYLDTVGDEYAYVNNMDTYNIHSQEDRHTYVEQDGALYLLLH